MYSKACPIPVKNIRDAIINIFQSKLYTLIYCRHFRIHSWCAMFDWSDTVFRRRNVKRRRISKTVLQPRYWGSEADSPDVCRLSIVYQSESNRQTSGWIFNTWSMYSKACPIPVKNVRDAIIESALRLTRRNFGGGLTRGLPIALRLILFVQ
jgi:hypothetical protein